MDEFNKLFDDHLFDIDEVKDKTIKLKEGERRMVSILFADVEGFTSLSEKLDHEDIQSLMDHIMKIFSHSIEVHGGYVDKYTGDQIMGLFGAKVASEVDTERAISSGLDMIAKLKKFNHIASESEKYHHANIDLSIRVGINTGMVTTGKIGKERAGDYTVYGDSVNLASRMESNAPTDSVMIPEYTMNLVRDSFVFKDHGIIKVKGKKESVSVYLVESKKDKKVSHISPFIGREDEIKQLTDIYNKCNKYLKIGMLDKLTFIGLHAEAGVGKSRLIYEFLNDIVGLDIDLYSSGTCSNISTQSYNLFISLIKDSFEISILDNEELAKEKLEKGIIHLISLNPGKDNQLHSAKVFLGLLLGIRYEDERLKDQKEVVNHIRISIRVFLECLCKKANTKNCSFIVVLEDLHWIDNMSLDTLEYLLQTFNIQDKRDNTNLSVPLFICTYRNEYTVNPKVTNECQFNDILLKTLSKESSFELIEELTEDIEIDEKKQIELYDKSSGNPFFIEEWVSLIKEKDISETLDDSRDLVNEYSIPNTLNSLILTRIDALEKDLKALLQNATIIGEDFFFKILSLLEKKLGLSDEIKKPVDELETENFIQHFLKQIDHYRFKHILTRDVAYSTILKSNKKILHRSVGEVIEENFKDIIERFYFDLAVHYDHAEEYKKALDYLEKAGNQFGRLLDIKSAINCYKRIIEIIKSQKIKKGDIYYRNQNHIGRIYSYLGETDKSMDIYKSLLKNENEIEKNTLSKIYLNFGNTYENIRENDASLKCYNKALKICEDSKNEDMIARIQRCIGIVMMNTGQFDKAIECYKKHMNHFKKSNNKIEIAIITGNIGAIYLHQGKLEDSYKCFDKQRQICEELDSKQLLQQALGNMALINNIHGKYESALGRFDEILTICEDINDKINLSNTYGNMGIAYKNLADHSRAIENLEFQLKIAKKSDYKRHICSAYTNLGRVYHIKGDFKGSDNFYQKSEKIILSINDKIEESILYGSKGMLYADMGKLDDALSEYQKSCKISADFNNVRGQALTQFHKGTVLFLKEEFKLANEELIKASKVFNEIGDLPNYAESLILQAKIIKNLNDIKEADLMLDKALDVSNKINSIEFINAAIVEKSILNMLKNKDSNSVASLTVQADGNISDELKAYIHFNLSTYGDVDESQSIALNLYKKLYKKSPKYTYKVCIDKLS